MLIEFFAGTAMMMGTLYFNVERADFDHHDIYGRRNPRFEYHSGWARLLPFWVFLAYQAVQSLKHKGTTSLKILLDAVVYSSGAWVGNKAYWKWSEADYRLG